MREIEIKVKVKNLEEISERLKERERVIFESVSQRDVIYSKDGAMKEWQSAKEGDIIMRLRYLKDSAEFSCKQQCSGELDNLEYETEVKNPAAVHKILLALGYLPKIEVKKIRHKGKLGEYEICLDEVEGLGSFVELEKLTSDEADPQKVREELFRALEFLGLSQADEVTRGYDTQIYQLLK